jgi:hypothetical protein
VLRIRSRGAYPNAHTQTHTHTGLCAPMLLRRTFGTHAGLHAHAFMRYPLSFKCECGFECEEKASVRVKRSRTHTHTGLCARDRVTCSAPKNLARGLPKGSHTHWL